MVHLQTVVSYNYIKKKSRINHLPTGYSHYYRCYNYVNELHINKQMKTNPEISGFRIRIINTHNLDWLRDYEMLPVPKFRDTEIESLTPWI